MSSSSVDEDLQKFNSYERHVYDSTDYEQIPVISDEYMFSEEANACNFLTPLVRNAENGNIFCDSLYVLEFLRRRRNTKNEAIINAFKHKKQLDDKTFADIVKSNFEITKNGSIDDFWKIFRNSDFNVAEMTEKRMALRFKFAKAYLFPCYMGDVESGDTSKSHVVLFVAYTHQSLREIHMYDSLIIGNKFKEIERFNYTSIKRPEDLKFKVNETTYDIFIQKTFHLIESFLHCLELFDFKNQNNPDDFIVMQINGKFQKLVDFNPSQYKFYKSGYGKNMTQQHHNCSSFVTYGMYDVLRNWTNFTEPHRMKMKEYDDLFLRPIITIDQYMAAFIVHFFFKQNINTRKSLKNINLSIQIATNSNTQEDYDLEQSLYENLKKCMSFFVKYRGKKNTLNVTISDVASIDKTSVKNMVILICDRSFQNTESIQTSYQLLRDISDSTNFLIVIYPTQAMVVFQKTNTTLSKDICLSLKEMKNSMEETRLLTYALPTHCSELKRPIDETISMLHAYKPDSNDLDDIVIELPPHGAELLIKPLGSNFIPFYLN